MNDEIEKPWWWEWVFNDDKTEHEFSRKDLIDGLEEMIGICFSEGQGPDPWLIRAIYSMIAEREEK